LNLKLRGSTVELPGTEREWKREVREVGRTRRRNQEVSRFHEWGGTQKEQQFLKGKVAIFHKGRERCTLVYGSTEKKSI